MAMDSADDRRSAFELTKAIPSRKVDRGRWQRDNDSPEPDEQGTAWQNTKDDDDRSSTACMQKAVPSRTAAPRTQRTARGGCSLNTSPATEQQGLLAPSAAETTRKSRSSFSMLSRQMPSRLINRRGSASQTPRAGSPTQGDDDGGARPRIGARGGKGIALPLGGAGGGGSTSRGGGGDVDETVEIPAATTRRGSVKAGGGAGASPDNDCRCSALESEATKTRPMRSTVRGRKASQMVTDAAEQQATARNMTPRKPGRRPPGCVRPC